MGTTWFAGGQALIDGQLVRADIAIAGGAIVDVITDRFEEAGRAVSDAAVDCDGLVVAPGFIDLQCNGANGVDITNEPHRIADVAAELPRFGVTAFLPTVVTSPAATRIAAIDQIKGQQPDLTAAAALGLHLEGPMISRDHLGAHVGRHAAAPADMLDEIDMWASSGAVCMVTLAPELARAAEVVERLHAAGVIVSAGHTGMTPPDFVAARSAGITYVTHLFNAMAPFGHRAPARSVPCSPTRQSRSGSSAMASTSTRWQSRWPGAHSARTGCHSCPMPRPRSVPPTDASGWAGSR